MNKIVKKLIIICLTWIVPAAAFAQTLPAQCQRVEMADGLYQSGKIYVVVSVLSIIFVGILVYLIILDRKISKLEKEVNNK